MTSRIRPSLRDWPEDAAHENGCYLCRCVVCHETFTGHKRRVVCHECTDRSEAEAKRRAEWLTAHDAPKDWVIMTTDEVRKQWADYSDLLLCYHVEQKVRRELAVLLDDLASDHFTRPEHWSDSIKAVLKASDDLDKPRENTPLPSPAGTGTVQA